MNGLLSNQEAEEIGEEYARKTYERDRIDSLCVDIESLATDILKLNLIYESFCGKDIDKIGFLADGRESVCVWREGKPQEVIFPWKTIVIDTDLLRNDSSGRKRFTIAHEIAHYLIDILITREQKAYAHREYDAELHNSRDKLLDVLGMPENRADRLAAALIMPKFNIDKAMERYADNKKFTIYGRSIILPDEKIRMQIMANGIGVSFSALRLRLMELNYVEYKTFDDLVKQDYLEGDFDDSDIDYDRSVGSLTPEQTYLIHRSRREYAKMPSKTIPCPACKHFMTAVTEESTGYTKFKCRKCKLESPFGMAYFRSKKNPSWNYQGRYHYIKKKR